MSTAVDEYYALLAPIYRMVKGESMHFAIYAGAESSEEAISRTERALADEGEFAAGMRVLEVGCGMGGPAMNIAAYSGVEVVGVDLVRSNVDLARALAAERGLAHRVHFQQANAAALPFLDGSFDGVYLLEAACHMPDQRRVFAECARVLRPGRLLVGQDWMAAGDLSPAQYATYLDPVCRWHCVPRLASLAEVGGWLREAGLRIEALEDAACRGNIQRNWEPVDNRALRPVLELPPSTLQPVLQTLLQGGLALATAFQAGAFQIGRFRARRPG